MDQDGRRIAGAMMTGGAYTAERAAALSGVPKSTVYYWARHGHLIPSVSEKETMLWSFSDLLGLRAIYWLRKPKKAFEREIRATSMSKVKHVLAELRKLGVDLIEHDRPIVSVTEDGDVAFESSSLPLQRVGGQLLNAGMINVIGVFQGLEGGIGPDLLQPMPNIRIVPRKLSGAPHVVDTRLPTQSLYALALRGMTAQQIHRLYPFVTADAIDDGVALELQLEQNLELAA